MSLLLNLHDQSEVLLGVDVVGMSQCGGWLIQGKMAGVLLPCSTSPTQDPGNVPPALASEPSQASSRAVSPTHRKSTKIQKRFGFDGGK